MSGFFGTNPPDTVVGSPDADEQTIAENAQDQNDTASGFYQGSPEQTTTDAYTADALASKNAAAVSEANAATSAANAATSEANAATSATSASNVASSIAGDASSATASAASALASKNAAATSETNSATSETNAATSATTAATSATTATTKASEASVSAANAATSESNAATSATNAATSATNAASSESSVSANATAAATSASSAATSATSATASASTATTKAAEASTSESNAATSATNAASSASSASTSATNASNSASSATTAQTAAEAARDSALAAFDSFDDRYLGQKSSNPSTDNDGNALVAGTLYFNTTTGEMKVYDGSAWLNAYASLSGALIATNNLSDLNNAGTARTNLGLGSAATTDASAYATAAQADQTVSLTGAGATSISGTYPSFTITSTDTDTTYSVGDGGLTQNNFTDALKTKLDGVATNANNYTLPFTDNSANWNTAFGWGNHASAGYLMDSELTSEASVKALNQGVATTDSPSFVKLIAKHDTADQLHIGNTTDTGFWTLRAGANLLFKDNGTVERMRIDSSGNVGIGTTAVDTKLHLEESGATSLFLKTQNSAGALLVGNNSAGNSFVSAQTSGKPLIFETENTERMRIAADGVITIPNTLQFDTSWNEPAIRFGSDAPFVRSDGQYVYWDGGGTSSLYYINGFGGITTDSKVTITDDDGLVVRSSTNGVGAPIEFSDHASGSYAQKGTLTYYHADSSSYGSGNAFVFDSSETTTSVVGHKAVFTNFLIKPSSGTGAGTLLVDSSRNITANYVKADRIYANDDGSTGYFFNDSGTRVAYTGGDFYFQSGVNNFYNYATNQYYGSTSGDYINFRGNTVTHNGWHVDSNGHFRMNDNKYFRLGSGSDVEHFWNGSNYYTDINGGANWYIRDGNTYNNTEFMLDIDNGHFHADGNIYAYSTSTNSDIKLKDNIATIENPFEVLNGIKGCSWTWKKDGSEGAGVVAQEVEKVMPSAVSDVKELNSEDTVKTVEYNQLIGVLIEAVKELKAEVEELKGGK